MYKTAAHTHLAGGLFLLHTLDMDKMALEGDHPDFVNYFALSYIAKTSSMILEHLYTQVFHEMGRCFLDSAGMTQRMLSDELASQCQVIN